MNTSPLDWTDDPDYVGEPDESEYPHYGPYSEPRRVVEVALGLRPFVYEEYADARCQAVAAIASSMLEFDDKVRPRPTTIVHMLQRMGLAGPGCRVWVLRLLHDVPIRRRLM